MSFDEIAEFQWTEIDMPDVIIDFLQTHVLAGADADLHLSSQTLR